MFDKRYQVDRTFVTVKKFSIHAEAASRTMMKRDLRISCNTYVVLNQLSRIKEDENGDTYVTYVAL